MTAKARIGITFCILAVTIVATGVPWYAHLRASEARAACIDMLRRIQGAKWQWALEHNASPNAVPTWEDLHYYGGRSGDDPWYDHYPPHCPAGGTYTIGRIADPPTCSIPGHKIVIVDGQMTRADDSD